MDEKQLKQAKTTFDTLCATLDDFDLKYKKDEEELGVYFTITGDDLPIGFFAQIDVERQLVRVQSDVEVAIPEDKRVELGIVISIINYALAEGCFDYNFLDGSISYRITASYRGSLLSKAVFEYILKATISIVERHNDQFLMIAKGKLSWQDIAKELLN